MSFLNEPLLLVPIHVDALAVGNQLPPDTMFQWTNLTPNFSNLKGDYHFGAELVGDSGASGSPFDEAAGLETGIHLHFRLPRAFSHGRQEGDGPLTFPPIPNRWLVQRFGDASVPYRAWLIKSDAPATGNSPGIPWPTFPNDPQTPVEFKLIGNSTEVTASLADGDESALVNLTVVGQGNPMFSAHYPACRSVLGFHDPMDDVSAGAPVSYLVSGWYSTATDDPMHSAASRTGTIPAAAEKAFRAKNNIPDGVALSADRQSKLLWDAWLSDRQWSCDFDPTVEPARLLCHGLVRGISWQAEGWNYMQPSGAGASVSGPTVFPSNIETHESAYQVAVGNTGGEALAALLASGDVDQDLLAGLQEGLLGQPVSAAELQYELHDRRFEGVQGGTTFAIQTEPDHSPVSDPGDWNPASRGQSAVLPRPLNDLLQQLNEKQSDYDRLSREIEDYRWQVYALWYLWTSEAKNSSIDSAKANKLLQQLNTFKDVLTKAKTDLDAARKDRDALCTAQQAPAPSTGKIIDELAKYPKTPPDEAPRLDAAGKPELKYRLVTSTALPFFEPSEPVIAVSGPAMARFNTFEPSGPIACRLSGQMVTGFMLQVPGGAALTVTGETLLQQLGQGQLAPEALGAVNKSLLVEALLLDSQQAANIAGQVTTKSLDELTKIVKALQDPESTAAQSNPPAAPNALIGSLPDRMASFNWQQNPWIPLLLVWGISWQSDYQSPAGQQLPDDLITARWTLDPTLGDFVPGNVSTGVGNTTYQGYSILTPSASKALADHLAALDESHPLIDRLTNQSAQLQKLGGFNEALILQQTGMQIPPLDFQRWLTDSSFFIDPIRAFLNDGFAPAEQRNTFRTAPDQSGNPFMPIRAGQMQITNLSVVDAFGQTLKLPVAQINESTGTSDSMLRPAHTVVAESASVGSTITLGSRFAQPMRLQCQWENSSSDQDPNGGPVCGWILPNYLEKSLTIYAANGKPLGALQKKLGQVSGTGDKSAYYWVDVPGQSGNVAGMDQDLVQRLAAIIKNIHLQYFCLWALGLSPDMGATFSSLLSDAIASTDQRVPDEDPGVSVLIGRPLALVRASFQFETAGLPAHRPLPRAGTGTSGRDLIETNGFEKVKWPLRFGDPAARNDGLIGVFQCVPATPGGDPATSGPFYPAWGQDKDVLENTVKVFAAQDFSINCVQPLEVTMLMDPQARGHATTGVLPRISFELPHEAVTGAKRAREVFFQTAPVLGFSPTPAMPRPSDDYGEWSWTYRPDVTLWKLDPNLIESTELGGFAEAWPTIAEGWLKLAIAPVKVLSFWLRERIEKVKPKTRVHLAWSLQGTESLELVKVKDDGKTLELVERWEAAPFPGEYGVMVEGPTTYRIIASAADAKPDSRDLTIKIAST